MFARRKNAEREKIMPQTVMVILGFSIIFLATTAGSAIVWFFKKDISEKVNTLFLGFASGVMIAASVWSLIIPSIEGAESWGKWNFVPALIGFLLGGLFLVLLDHVVPHFHNGTNEEEGPRSSLKKSTKMFLAVTIHNIPEGLAVGFAFGAAAAMGEYSAYVSAKSRYSFSICSSVYGGSSASRESQYGR